MSEELPKPAEGYRKPVTLKEKFFSFIWDSDTHLKTPFERKLVRKVGREQAFLENNDSLGCTARLRDSYSRMSGLLHEIPRFRKPGERLRLWVS